MDQHDIRPEVINYFSCSTLLSMNFILLTTIGILTFITGYMIDSDDLNHDFNESNWLL